MARYRRKPVDVEAFRFDGTRAAARELCGRFRALEMGTSDGEYLLSCEGFDDARAGDWVIMDAEGEVTLLDAETFAQQYEPG